MIEKVTKFLKTSMVRFTVVPTSVGTKKDMPSMRVVLMKLAPMMLPNARLE